MLGEPAEEMSARGRELVTADESTIVAKSSSDAIVIKDSQGDRSLSDPGGTNESNLGEVFYESNNLLDQLVASKENPRWWRWQFPGCAGCKRKTLSPLAVEIANLFLV